MNTEEQTTESDYGKERSWGYQELAILYFPHVKPESASRQLARWIARNYCPNWLPMAGNPDVSC